MPALKLADLSSQSFFALPEARALVVTDAKIDDALALWIFFLQNFRRPAGHCVDIRVLVVGVADVRGATALVRHLFEGACQRASAEGALAGDGVKLQVLSSRTSRHPARHESDTYAPYLSGGGGFTAASGAAGESRADAAASLAAERWSGDFVLVLAQYFGFECLEANDAGATLCEPALRCIVPRQGGMLVFQTGFNTNMPARPELHEQLWAYLRENASVSSSKIVFISNAFSFAKGRRKPGQADPSAAPFVAALKSHNPLLWEHLFAAGVCESLKFGTDQMAKWLSFMNMPGVDYAASGLDAPICAMLEAHRLTGSQGEISISLQTKFKSEVSDGRGGPDGAVRALCEELRALVAAKLGPQAADYLGRAVGVFDKFGSTLEITDGQHMVAVLQGREATLHPAEVAVTSSGQGADAAGQLSVRPVHGGVPAEADWRLWMAREIDPERASQWMDEVIMDPQAGRELIPV